MAKFTSYDGVDKNGTRAEVTVQTGTGRIKEIVGRGKENEDGTYRNVEVVFDPDNPLLKRKVYGLLDTNATELWAYVQAAHAEDRTVSYRIESQRRNGVDRSLAMGDLNSTEQVRRILAGVDGHFSHEAKSNPAEDPDNENPSALGQPVHHAPAAAPAAGPSATPDRVLAALAQARHAGMPDVTIDTIAGQALAAGATIAQVQTAGFDTTADTSAARDGHTAFASEEKPWMVWNSDGRVNYGSYAVARAAEAEQFALDHLIEVYTPAKSKTTIDVTETIVAQAAAIALQLLDLADKVQVAAYGGGRPDRMKNSHARALGMVTDTVGKRHPVPVGGTEDAQAAWADLVVAEASERLYGLGEIAHGRTPKPLSERDDLRVTQGPAPVTVAAVTADPVTPVAAALDMLGGQDITPFHTGTYPADTEPGFIAPDAAVIARLRDLCEKAQVAQDTRAISDWIEHVVGVRSARKVHAPVLEAFCTHYEQAGPVQVRVEVLGAANAA
jgi:hypothetical protein